tara:strand:- start:1071 stop:1646 length:576 start_codon:yes stop_codon:yes gene_type:complete
MARSAVMLRQACRLIPFERSIPPGVQISAELVWRSEGWLDLSYGVLARAATGIGALTLPEGLTDGAQQGQRKDELWTTTCFEAFIAAPGAQRYWEVNLAANGDWAVYRFDGYRSGQSQQELSTPPTLRLQRGGHQLRLDARIALEPWWTPGVCPDLALTAVIDRGQEGLSHWALCHGQQADFHDRSTFLSA